MSNTGMPNSYFSYGNYEMTNGNVASSMNLHANQAWMDSLARQNLYQVPILNFGATTQYPVLTSNNYLCDPMWTIAQGQLANVAGGGQGFFSGMQFPWMNGFGTTSSSSSAKTDAEKEEEALKKQQYEALRELLNLYMIVNKSIKPELKVKIETAFKKSGKIEDKLAALEEAYKAIPKAQLRKTMALMDTKGTGYRQALENAGYAFGKENYSFKSGYEKEINGRITKLENEIDKIKNADNAPTEFRTILDGDGKNNEILRLISYWNDKHPSDNILDSVISNLPSNTEQKKSAYNNYIQPLVEKLLEKASEVASEDCFDEDTISGLHELMEDLQESKAGRINKLNDLKSNFEKLYVMLRQMEALRINSEINAKYSFLNDIDKNDTDFIDKDLIIADTIADLRTEGLEDVSEEIASDIKISDIEDAEDADDVGVTSEKNVTENVKKLVEKEILKETTATYDGETVYVESRNTGDRKHPRTFIIQDGEMKELENARTDGTKLYYIDSSKEVTLKTVNSKDIKSDYKKIVETEEKIENEKKSYDTAYEDGKKLWDAIEGWTSSGENDEVNRILNDLNSENILGVVSGAVATCDDTEMLIEKLTDGSDASPEQIVNLLTLTLDKANELGLADTNEYKEFEKLYKAVAEEGKALDDTYEWNWDNIGSADPTKMLYSEALDRALEKLVIKMNEKTGHSDYKVKEKGQFGAIGVIVSGLFEPVAGILEGGWNIVKGAGRALWNVVEGGAKCVYNVGKGIVKGIGSLFGF